MGAGMSKEEMVFQAVQKLNLKGIEDLRRQGASLEWKDPKGKTPLMLACSRADMYPAAALLLQLGANAHAYCAGPDGGFPLHLAARHHGLDRTITLLMSYGANPLVMNDAGRTALDFARQRGFVTTVRMIEERVCLFAGMVRQQQLSFSFLEAIVPQLVFKSVWLVVLPAPIPAGKPTAPAFQLAIYSSPSASSPSNTVNLSSSKVSMAKPHSSDPICIVEDLRSGDKYKFLRDKNSVDARQMDRLYSACQGISQRTPSTPASSRPTTTGPRPQAAPATSAPGGGRKPTSDEAALALALEESLRTASAEGAARKAAEEAAAAAAGPSSSSSLGVSSNLGGWGPEPSTAPTIGGWGADVPVQQPPPTFTSVLPAKASSSLPPPAASASAVEASEPVGAGDWGDASESTDGGWGVPLPVASTPAAQLPAAFAGIASSPPASASAFDGNALPPAPPTSLPTAPSFATEAEEPSAPPLPSPLAYPSIDDSPLPPLEMHPMYSEERVKQQLEAAEKKTGAAQCVICWDSPAEAVCVPCGHVAGCMDCLSEVKEKDWGCPVCRAPIEKVIKLFHV